jgi:hypothetical protein
MAEGKARDSLFEAVRNDSSLVRFLELFCSHSFYFGPNFTVSLICFDTRR